MKKLYPETICNYIRKWERYCDEKSVNVFHPTEAEVVSFLSALYDSNLGYSGVNTARSALAAFIDVDKFPIVRRCIRGFFNARYKTFWDVRVF
jgi:hypothetical protein